MADEKKATEEKKESAKLSKKVQKIVDSVKELSLMDVAELVKALEDEFGVSAAAPVMAAAPAAGAAAPVEEQSEFDVILKDGAKVSFCKFSQAHASPF